MQIVSQETICIDVKPSFWENKKKKKKKQFFF